jgi:hypothetical protein
MPIRSGLIVVMRLFAMLLILQVLAYIYVLAVIFGRGDSTLALPQIAMMSLLLIPTLLIFWCSDAIIDFLAPRSSELRPEGPVSGSELQAIAFSAMGAFILYLAFGETIGMLATFHYAGQTPGMSLVQAPELFKTLAGWIVGIFLLLGGPGLRAFLVTARRAGTQHD